MKGRLFVFSAPSGCGKTTILKGVFERIDGLKFSISSTTRAPRKGERDGVDYFFITEQEFRTRVRQNRFLEWAEVHGNLYGTDRKQVEEALNCGLDLIMDIDVQGARQVKCAMPEAVTVFILPPSWKELERRLRDRGTDDEDSIRRRLQNAYAEVSEAYWYDYAIVNDAIDKAIEEVVHIITSFRLQTSRLAGFISGLLSQKR
ncbi:MAG TPA: guanylate kinase [Thermodesulforhabdus norvegica]|uniref:Guanylate kinase n=1 Tax=Thermodesulforhabdus norvegica TaxID=39841 RepID=A0A7C0WSY7_9BACT|nr:guanylate kinase [Thermodesulforhabdus norvegica]